MYDIIKDDVHRCCCNTSSFAMIEDDNERAVNLPNDERTTVTANGEADNTIPLAFDIARTLLLFMCVCASNNMIPAVRIDDWL